MDRTFGVSEREYYEWVQNATEADFRLANRVESLAPLFEDMLFKGTSLLGIFTNETSLNHTVPGYIENNPFDIYVKEYFDIYQACIYRVEKLEGYSGSFSPVDWTLTLDPECVDDDRVILHEMIHMHESAINELPSCYKEILLIALYRDLKPKIADLDERINRHCVIMNQVEFLSNFGSHGLLFLLKSFDLDLKLGHPLGTIFGYGMTEEIQ